MAPNVSYHCPCLSDSTVPPPPHHLSSSSSFHPLHELFFCEECDAIRCNTCVSVEVSGYYCPNCLFEVPSASVRAEKNRRVLPYLCARNCFLCPCCRNTLSVVPSDPPETDDGRTLPVSAVGEPPFFLYCNYCRWDSAEVDITFEKPTGLAGTCTAQLQKFEDSAPDSLEFERLKEHFEPFLLRAGATSSLNPTTSAHSHHHVNPVTAAASSALARDIPGVAKYTPAQSTSGRRSKGARDEMPEYKARVDASSSKGAGLGGEPDVEFMRRLETVSEVASLEQRWSSSWAVSLRLSDIKPLRMPLHSRKSKRCPSCRHILIKPEQKAQSVRYKIKLVAANYIPAITVSMPAVAERRATLNGQATASAAEASLIQAGRSYPFHLALTNPLYDPVQVRLQVQRQLPAGAPRGADDEGTEKARRPPFAVTLPNTAFPIAAFAEAWEYEDDEDMLDDDEFGPERGAREKDARKNKTVGVLERRANVTIVGGEVLIGKDARGELKFNMLVSYTYRSDDPLAEDDVKATPSRRNVPEMKTFSFCTIVSLGTIVPREESRSVNVDL
ncbi:dynactin p62 family-domain-containing protein [Vararia minispora EC-137]|uniref:Dynactin p62 family-domain-containing protein n=1 Tax=Vararia minispora EC-137 TaxID=1314806 RepID=A0ACB8Q7E1_9AGAM|nr:dynactin p62 family-domain-containing protein [Vararia minispora EC-137]